ncbi:MAG: hypothetical protein KAW92_10500 [Candidatus Cloacimonetes bacterium]|nr:hypothetical protein [Candidatus Cloacimonadota bacterium]
MIKVWAVHVSRIIPGKEIFRLHDEKGFPLEMSCILANEKGMIIDWEGFIKKVMKSKNFNNIDKLIKRIKVACQDAGYNKKWWKERCRKEPDKFRKEKE